jgi:sodium-dependent phosphate cotransporter
VGELERSPPKNRIASRLGRILQVKQIRKIGMFAVSIALFVLALELMKAGARGLAPLTNDLLHVEHPVSGLGFGWLTSYLVLSGSPVAAMALTFLDVATIGPHTAFAMIVGSRVGASAVVVLIGLLYMLRGHGKTTSLLVGLLTLIITVTIYIFALPLGLTMLSIPVATTPITLPGEASVASLVDLVFGWPVELAAEILPDWGVFVLGLGVTVLSLNLIDGALPELDKEENVFGRFSKLLYRPSVTFVLGLILTLLTMSVSVSLGLLVPLSARGYIRRENLIPYIMGCNISTFIDTLIAGILLRNPIATNVVLIQMLSILMVSLVILALFYHPYERLAVNVALWLNERRGRLAVLFLLILLIPLALIVAGRL